MITKLAPRLLNKEVDEILVKPNEFVDAVNVKIDGDEGTDSGIIKFADGNAAITFATGDADGASTIAETIVGVCEDERDDRIYIFASSPTKDSVYMAYDDEGTYRLRLLARSNSLDLDQDNFVAADVIRIYNTEIDSTGSDSGGGGLFSDSVVLTDFDDSIIIDPTEIGDGGDSGLAQLIITGGLDFPAESVAINTTFGTTVQYNTPLQNGNILVQNIGTGPATITFNLEATCTNPNAIPSISVVPPGPQPIPAGGTQVFFINPTVVSAEPGDSVTCEVTLFTDIPGFAPVFYDATTTFVASEIFSPTVEYLPNPSLSHADFPVVPSGTSADYVRQYSIINATPTSEDSTTFSPHLVGQIDLLSSSQEVDDATFLSHFDTSSNTYIEADTLDFSIAPGEQYDFSLHATFTGAEVSFAGQAQPSITYLDGDLYPLTYGQQAPPDLVGQGLILQVQDPIEEEDLPPVLNVLAAGAWNGITLEADPLSFIPSLGLDGTSTGEEYGVIFTEQLGESDGTATVNHNYSFADGFIWGGNVASLFEYKLNGSTLPQTNFHSFDVPAGGVASYSYNLNYTDANLGFGTENSDIDFIQAVQDFEGDVVLNVTTLFGQIDPNNGSIISIDVDTAQILFQPVPSQGLLILKGAEIPGAQNNGWGDLNDWSTSALHMLQQGNVDSQGSGSPPRSADFIIAAKHNGSSPMPVPNVYMTNTRNVVTSFGPLSGTPSISYLSVNSTDYDNNDVVWSGEGMGRNITSTALTSVLSSIVNDGKTGYGTQGWKILPMGAGYTPGAANNTIDQKIDGVAGSTNIGGWFATDPNTNVKMWDQFGTLDVAFLSLSNGFADTVTTDPFEFREFLWNRFINIDPIYSPWFVDGDDPDWDGFGNPSNPVAVTEIQPNQTVFLAFSIDANWTSESFASLRIVAPSVAQNPFNQWRIGLKADLSPSGTFRPADLPPEKTPRESAEETSSTGTTGTIYTSPSTKPSTSRREPRTAPQPQTPKSTTKPLKIKKPTITGNRVRTKRY